MKGEPANCHPEDWEFHNIRARAVPMGEHCLHCEGNDWEAKDMFRTSAIVTVAVCASALSIGPAVDAQATPVVGHGAATGCGSGASTKYPVAGNYAAFAASMGMTASDPLLTRASREHVRWLTHASCMPVKGHTHRRVPIVQNSNPSSNWSGFVGQSVAGTNGAEMDWTVPSVKETTTAPQYVSIWAGVGTGASPSNELIQDGTEDESRCTYAAGSTCGASTQTHYFWLETYDNTYKQPEDEVTSMTPHIGDQVGTYAKYAGSLQASFIFCDFTQSVCQQATKSSPGPSGPQSEWIVERPTVNGTLPDLADFGTLSLTLCEWTKSTTGSTTYTMGATNPAMVVMDNSAFTHPLAQPSGTGAGTSFSDTWKAAN